MKKLVKRKKLSHLFVLSLLATATAFAVAQHRPVQAVLASARFPIAISDQNTCRHFRPPVCITVDLNYHSMSTSGIWPCWLCCSISVSVSASANERPLAAAGNSFPCCKSDWPFDSHNNSIVCVMQFGACLVTPSSFLLFLTFPRDPRRPTREENSYLIFLGLFSAIHRRDCKGAMKSRMQDVCEYIMWLSLLFFYLG